jgi:hypothetical protein
MSALTYKHEWTLELPKLTAPRYQHRNLCVQVQRSSTGNYRAVLVDLEEFRGDGLTQATAIDELADDLEEVAAEIQRASGKIDLDLARAREVYAAVLDWRRHVTLVPAEPRTKAMLATVDAAILAEGQRRHG